MLCASARIIVEKQRYELNFAQTFKRRCGMLKIVTLIHLFVCLLISLPVPAAQLEDITQPLYTGQVLLKATEPDPIVLHIAKFHAPSSQFDILKPTIEALEKTFGKGKLQVEVFRGALFDVSDAHLLITSAGAYRRHHYLGTNGLATLVSDSFPDPNKAEGSAIIVKSDRQDLQTLRDLSSATLSTTSPFSFVNYQVALREMQLQHISPKHAFGKQIWTGNLIESLTLLRDNKVDVVIARSCTLEILKTKGVDVSFFKVLNKKTKNNSFPCVVSTDLYPNWTFFATSRASAEIARKASETLFSMPPLRNNLRWSVATDFTLVDDLMYHLQDGQFEYIGHWSLGQFWENYKIWILVVLGLFATFALHSWRTEVLLQRRTNELMSTQQEVMRISDTLTHLQKVGIVGQISTVIAHELRQPLSVVVSYIHGVQRLLDQGRINPSVLEEALMQIKDEVVKINDIVERVRDYAKQQKGSRTAFNLSDLINKNIEELEKYSRNEIKVARDIETLLPINANAVEMRLVIINLLKNAMQAALMQPKPIVQISAKMQGDVICLKVTDNGPRLDEISFKKIMEPLKSSKLTGLGLGLMIVNLIIENHSGTLQVSQNTETGLTFTVTLPGIKYE